MSRIWPGALCQVTHPREFGRIVIAHHVITSQDQGREGMPLAKSALGHWMCEFQGDPVLQTNFSAIGVFVYTAPIAERWLRPILPPPESEFTEDRAPCEVEA